jgi:hypothetical protein
VFSSAVVEGTLDLFKAFTDRPLLSFIGDRSFIAVGSSDWVARAKLFPGVLAVSPRSASSKISPEMRQYLATVADDKRSLVTNLALCFGPAGCRHAFEALVHLSCSAYLHANSLEFHCPPRDVSAAVEAVSSSAGV